VFWGFLLVAVGLVAVIAAVVTSDVAPKRSVTLNLPGVATFTAAVMLFVVATVLMPEPHHARLGVGLLICAAALVVVFAVVDQHAAAPLLPHSLLGSPPLRQGAVGAWLNTAATSSAVTLVRRVIS
jgi:zinc transporter ZupT